MSKNVYRERHHGRFWFGEAPDEQWSAEETGCSAYDYLVNVCPTTKDALEKLRVIRRAARSKPLGRDEDAKP